MDFINQLNLGSGVEIALIAAICYAVTQAVKQTNIGNHWLPWISMAVGVVAGEVAGMSQGDSHYLSLGILGLLIGGATVGLFDGFKAPAVALKNKDAANIPQQVMPINNTEKDDLQNIISNTQNSHYDQVTAQKGGDSHGRIRS
ncbi:hypothetical protein DS832_06895 [Bombilactobacillus bombi]|uniref:Holin n=1 Tax=Bombilactobacillus bombi TaxID=1303590 RepID=A0A417Z5Q5_9LACO|nr:holin [Bombilactobacillus bombi]RHW46070.1 hypothetical protein DS832_06895 [Bombilactobacillus bombi]